MRRHGWGIYWLLALTWQGSVIGFDLATNHPWFAALAGAGAVLCAVMAYRDLTKLRVGTVTITITPDTRGFDAAIKRAMRSKP
jgi:hypothetical protein